MALSIELQNKIKRLFKDNEVIRDKLLSVDADTIREIGRISQIGIGAEEIVVAFESNDPVKLEELREKAKKLFEMQNLYKELCFEFCVKTRDISPQVNESNKKR